MSDKQLRSMDKTQLLKIMRQQEIEIERLTSENSELVKRIKEIEIEVEEAEFSNKSNQSSGSIKNIGIAANIESANSTSDSYALASGIIQSAQEAADLYLKNIRLMENMENAENSESSKKNGNEKQQGTDGYISNDIKSDIANTELDLRLVSYRYIEFIDKAHKSLHEMLEKYKLITKLPQINEYQETHRTKRTNEFTQTGDRI